MDKETMTKKHRYRLALLQQLIVDCSTLVASPTDRAYEDHVPVVSSHHTQHLRAIPYLDPS